MYKVIGKIPERWPKSRSKPLIVLESEHGGQSVITTDDHCFVLYNGSDKIKMEFEMVKWWYKEAAEALQNFMNENPNWSLALSYGNDYFYENTDNVQ